MLQCSVPSGDTEFVDFTHAAAIKRLHIQPRYAYLIQADVTGIKQIGGSTTYKGCAATAFTVEDEKAYMCNENTHELKARQTVHRPSTLAAS